MADYSDVYDPNKSLQDYKDDLIKELLEINPNLDISEATPIMNIISIWSSCMETIMQTSMAMYNDQSPYTASLEALINIYGAYYGIEYKAGSRTQQQITITTTGPCSIYANTTSSHTQFQIADALGNIYIPTSDKSFDSAGTYEVMFESEEYSAISSDLNSITNIITTTLNVESVNNTKTYSSLGSERETTEEYRKRILQASRFYKSSGSASSIEDSLINIGCEDAFIYKNYGANVSKGVPSGAIAVIVKGVNSEDLQLQVANILANNIQSAYMYGFDSINVVKSVTYERYVCYTCFNNAQQVDFNLTFTIISETMTTSQKNALKKYVAEQIVSQGLQKIYKRVNTMDIMSIVKTYLEDNNISGYATDMFFSRVDDPTTHTAVADIQNIYEYPNISEANITIN